MPYLHRFTRVTISGTSFGGAEEWSTGFNYGYVTGDADMPTQAFADKVRDEWAIFFKHHDAYISNRWFTTLVKVSSVGMDGKSNAADTVFSEFLTSCQGTTGDSFPPQIALVASLLGTDPRGVASKGRMYLPGVAAGLDATGHIPDTQRNEIHAKFAAFLHAVTIFDGTPNVPLLASPGSLNKDGTPKIGGSSPKMSEVVRTKLGNVYDTQRRRRNGLVEQYVSALL
jgi:hypothetical protein